MPSLDLACGPSEPLIQVVLGVSRPHADALTALGRPSPPPVLGTFLIDTGASHTVVDVDLIEALGLTPTGFTPIQTPSTGGAAHICDEYDVMLQIPHTHPSVFGHVVEAMPIIASSLRAQGIDGLIGRDVLAECVLIVNGPGGTAILGY